MAPRISRTARPEHRIVVDRTSKVPIHGQVSRQLTAAIVDGTLAPGDMIENEVDLSMRLGISRPTLQKAIAELVSAGYVTRKPGRGTVVLPRTIPRRVSIGSLYDDLAAADRAPTTSVLAFERSASPPPRLATRSGGPVDDLVYIRRIRTADGEPLAMLRNWLPAGLVTFGAADLEQRGLYDILRDQDVLPHLAEQRMGCRRGDESEVTLLERVGDPVMTVERLVFDAKASFIEYGEHSYRAGRYFFETVLVGDDLRGEHVPAPERR
ncbi:GntR family transcriptional regulator [Aeromicrobium sp. CF4.19]|uniref:GntR family transcriptional regulator n=1 Tax=Aeromicrobium sp. CF4.19 TaxID=3373082 RepID=UPI003EE50AAC